MIIDLSREVARRHLHSAYAVVQPVPDDNGVFLFGVLGSDTRPHYLSRQKIYRGERNNRFPIPTVSLAIQATHLAFDQHLGLTLRPDTLWYMIVSQVAEFIKLHPDEYAFMFTTKPDEKQLIEIRDDSLVYGSEGNDWGRTIELFRTPLRAAVIDVTADLFLANFTTTTPEDEVAVLVTFMDAASPYFKYRVNTLCGITSIQLLGTPEDYELLLNKTSRLANAFPALEQYFNVLLQVLSRIAESFTTSPDLEFWNSLYRFKAESGMDTVTGWINAFQIFRQTQAGLVMKEYFDWEQHWSSMGVSTFPSHVSKVDFVWNYYGQHIPMAFAAGVIGVDYTEGRLDPRLGFGIYELGK
jgi:hypothetical protein